MTLVKTLLVVFCVNLLVPLTVSYAAENPFMGKTIHAKFKKIGTRCHGDNCQIVFNKPFDDLIYIGQQHNIYIYSLLSAKSGSIYRLGEHYSNIGGDNVWLIKGNSLILHTIITSEIGTVTESDIYTAQGGGKCTIVVNWSFSNQAYTAKSDIDMEICQILDGHVER
jgi:hypothetical protein